MYQAPPNWPRTGLAHLPTSRIRRWTSVWAKAAAEERHAQETTEPGEPREGHDTPEGFVRKARAKGATDGAIIASLAKSSWTEEQARRLLETMSGDRPE